MKIPKSTPLFLAAVVLISLSSSAAQTQYDSGDPTADEQYVLEVINRARANPTAEGTRLKIDINAGLPAGQTATPKPPLAMNKILLGTARAHSLDMYTRKFFAHVNPDGKDPFARLTAAGYSFNAAGENIAAGTNYSAFKLEDLLMIDQGEPGAGHRVNLLNTDPSLLFREIGIGYLAGATPIAGSSQQGVNGLQDFITQDFGSTSSTGPFVMGVVYNDLNGNNFYDQGEGIAGVTITPDSGNFFAVTGTAGGFTIPVGKSGTVTFTASGGTLTAPVTMQVTLTGVNAKVDFVVSGMTGGGGGNGGTAPVISSALTAGAVTNKAFSYTVTATGTAPITFAATGLPPGLSISGSTISGTATQAGQFQITLTATNATGTDTKTLIITVSDASIAPTITSPLTANATQLGDFNYTITAAGTQPISFSATGLPFGLTLSGSTISGIPALPGQFMITLKATNGVGADTQTLVLTIAPAVFVSNSSKDSDGDGFPDELETFLGTSPTNKTSTPFAGAAVVPQALALKTKQIKLNFARANMDAITLVGTLPIPAGFAVTNQTVTMDVGGVMHTFTLDSKGHASTPGFALFTMRIKSVKKVVVDQAAPYTIRLTKGAFASSLTDEGLLNATVKLTVSVPITIIFNQQLFATTATSGYTAKAAKTGLFK